MGCKLPNPGLLESKIFYFNIAGSNNARDVKLIAFLSNDLSNGSNQCVFFDNENDKIWLPFNDNLSQWQLPTTAHFSYVCLDYWVLIACIILIFFFFIFFIFFFFFFFFFCMLCFVPFLQKKHNQTKHKRKYKHSTNTKQQ